MLWTLQLLFWITFNGQTKKTTTGPDLRLLKVHIFADLSWSCMFPYRNRLITIHSSILRQKWQVKVRTVKLFPVRILFQLTWHPSNMWKNDFSHKICYIYTLRISWDPVKKRGEWICMTFGFFWISSPHQAQQRSKGWFLGYSLLGASNFNYKKLNASQWLHSLKLT